MTHGHDGWMLLEYEWDPTTEVGTFTYEKAAKGETQTVSIQRYQPVVPKRLN